MINVDGKYYITADRYCYTVNQKKHNSAQNVDFYVSISYHRTIKECIDKIITLQYKEYINSNEVSLKESLDKLLILKTEYRNVLNDITEIEKDIEVTSKEEVQNIKDLADVENEELEKNEENLNYKEKEEKVENVQKDSLGVENKSNDVEDTIH